MFNFFDGDQNMFMTMMNMGEAEDSDETEDSLGGNDMNPFSFMQQAFMMQMRMMQMTQAMFMMPMQMMSAFMPMMDPQNFSSMVTGLQSKMGSMTGMPEGDESCFTLGNISIPPALIRKLMQIDMSPENLEKLQGVLDFVFASMPQKKNDTEDEE